VSNISNWSGWSPSSPASVRANSDFGDIDIDTRELLTSTKGPDAEIIDNPFAFTQAQLGRSLYDPKNLSLLRAMMGAEGLAMGLRVDLHQGLSPDEDKLDGHVTLEDVWRRFEGLDEVDDVRADGNNAPHDQAAPTMDAVASQHQHPNPTGWSRIFRKSKPPPSSSKGFTDRRRVLGENRIPVRPLKNIFQLVWIALQDKIIVPPFVVGHN
jgi:Ca2+-transporting ATPase